MYEIAALAIGSGIGALWGLAIVLVIEMAR